MSLYIEIEPGNWLDVELTWNVRISNNTVVYVNASGSFQNINYGDNTAAQAALAAFLAMVPEIISRKDLLSGLALSGLLSNERVLTNYQRIKGDIPGIDRITQKAEDMADAIIDKLET